jgi:hypothetical protein
MAVYVLLNVVVKKEKQGKYVHALAGISQESKYSKGWMKS